MLPLLPPSTDVAVDHQTLDWLQHDLAARHREAAARLAEAQRLQAACAKLPPASRMPDTMALLASQVDVAARRLTLYEQALRVVQEARSTR